MKTLKFALIAAILSIAMISQAGNDPSDPPVKKVIKITLNQALEMPGLVAAMYEQLDGSFLKKIVPSGRYTAHVRYNLNIYAITGTRAAWGKFFFSRIEPLVGTSGTKQ